MAMESDDCEQWLLPQFLTDDDDQLFADFKNANMKNDSRNTTKTCFGMDFLNEYGYGFGPFGSQSDLSSPVEGSTETESDDDDFMTGLTQKLAQSTLRDSALAYENNQRGWGSSGSPQSTLCSALCGGCGCTHGSSRGSPNCPSRVASPPGINRNDGAWDLLYAAAGEVARMRMMEGAASFHPNKNVGLVGPPGKPSPISVPQRTPCPQNLGFHPDHHHAHVSYQQHLKAAQFEQLRQQQMMKQQQATGAWGQGKFQLSQTQQMILERDRSEGRKLNISMAAWPTLQQSQRQHPGSGMRAVFLGNPSSRKECAGTGVFLPRRLGTPAETRKKSACSTVLLPDRVVQALNLNLKTEAGGAPAQPRYSGGLATDYAAAMRYRNGLAMAQQRRSVRQQPVMMDQIQELPLPQEWTY
ncbi:hypothetical protein ACH5RR_004917 [Cinchona calisaya]|uniref:Uncharacterized protein n=1 Tax=Cinchona calisaya TaxID=153742 RepID=A0ABD3AZ34_9GENT